MISTQRCRKAAQIGGTQNALSLHSGRTIETRDKPAFCPCSYCYRRNPSLLQREVLYGLFLRHGKPEFVRSDNGPEFASKVTQRWLEKVGVNPIRVYPGSPWENGYNERFNGTLRREVLNSEWFTTTRQAQIVINCWLRQYNHTRPHQALNMRPPVPETLNQNGP
ncbi:integrase core domain-containing protein [Leisingera sp. McT4-56]|uniref:integrase core domain-containing protein n=1 Tax=Leisingera sp. McT4-56 TaxID=2881255 RepID=UPI001CF87959|nr:integrase core domain-containing protein [Leisingera sp. McT4-56]MCB4457332.1 integrase core domain-containing protein [Leisingera sp. McT4-56]